MGDLCRRFARVFIVCAVAAVIGPRVHAADDEVLQLSVWLAQGKETIVVKKVAHRVWKREEDPRLVIAYCTAQFGLLRQRSECPISPASPRQIQQFGTGLWTLWNGQARLARDIFEALSSDPQWTEWGRTGLLEWASHTTNHAMLESLLKDYSAWAYHQESRFAKLHDEYSVRHALQAGEFDKIEKLLGRYPLQEILKTPWLFGAYCRRLFVMDQPKDLHEMLRRARPALGRSSTYLAAQADHLWLESGLRASWQLLKKHAKTGVLDVGMSLESAYTDILYGSSEESAQGLERVLNVAAARKRDPRMLLDISISLALSRKHEQAIQVRRMIDVDTEDLKEFTSYYTYEAWEAVYAGDLERARKDVGAALARSAGDFEANRLKALIAKSQNDAHSAVDALNILLQVDPYNENHANVFLYFRDRGRTPDLDAICQTVIRRASHYSPAFRGKILDTCQSK